MADGGDCMIEKQISCNEWLQVTVGQAKEAHAAGIKYVIKKEFLPDYDQLDAIRNHEDWWNDSNRRAG
jgi:hypothetical protein